MIMKKSYVVAMVSMILLLSLISNGVAQDYTQWRLPDSAKARLGKGSINEIKYSPDDKLLAVATSIGVWLYDAETGAEIALLKEKRIGHRHASRIAFSPDSKTVASTIWRYSGPIKLWDIASAESRFLIEGKIGVVKALKFSADGINLLCAHTQRDVKLTAWQISTGNQILDFSGKQRSSSGIHTPLVVSQDANLLASASGNTIRIWDVDKNRLLHVLDEDVGVPRNTSLAQILALSHDGKILAGGRTTVQLWDVENGEKLGDLLKQPRAVGAMTFSPNGKILAIGDYDGTISLWDLPLKNNSTAITITEHNSLPIKSLDFTSNNNILASGSTDSTVRISNITNKNQDFAIHGHTTAVKCLKFLQDGKTVFSCGADGTFRFWDSDKRTERLYPTEQKWHVFALAMSKDEKTIALGSVDGIIRLWDADTRTEIATLIGHTYGSVFKHLQFSEDGKTLGSVSFWGETIVWDVEKRKELYKLPKAESSDLIPNAYTFSPDLKRYTYAVRNKEINLWELPSGEINKLKPKSAWWSSPKDRDFRALTFSPNGRLIASGDWRGGFQLWDVNTHQHLVDFKQSSGSINALRFSPDGSFVAKGGPSGEVELWNVEAQSRVWYNHSAHSDEVTHFTFSQDQRTLASGSRDGTILIWDVSHVK